MKPWVFSILSDAGGMGVSGRWSIRAGGRPHWAEGAAAAAGRQRGRCPPLDHIIVFPGRIVKGGKGQISTKSAPPAGVFSAGGPWEGARETLQPAGNRV